MSFIYLATPYTHASDIVREDRFKAACQKAADLMISGEKVFSPIAHSHPVEFYGMDGEIKSGDFWLDQDFAILQHASKLVVYKIDGWDKSAGIERELAFARDNGIPIEFIDA